MKGSTMKTQQLVTSLAFGLLVAGVLSACDTSTTCKDLDNCTTEAIGGSGTGGMSTSATSIGGASSFGGATSTGGASATGGSIGTGGTGGIETSIGGVGTGGSISTGGIGTGTGGFATGGIGTGGMATGGAGTGGFVSACNPACSDTKPICNESAATCVECVSNGNCPTSKPACDPATNVCVGCMANSYCASPTPACKMASYTCVQCIDNGYCSSPTPACNTATNLCVQCTGNSNCSGATPACNTATNLCVQCTGDGNCSGATPLCDTAKNTCVECLSSADCKSPAASVCSGGTCSPCASNADCSHIAGKGICKISSPLDGDAGIDANADAGSNDGECVQCTAVDESPCADKSCNPATDTCTTTGKNTVDVCHPCVADSECIDDNAASVHPSSRCVPMKFKGTEHGSYCLPRVASGCASPYKVPIVTASQSGSPSEDYCGINQSATTCEAILDLSTSKACSNDANCGIGQSDGLCRTVGVDPNRCTIPCDLGVQCPSSLTCSSTINGYCK